jgi:hypothetical protein
VRLAVVLAGSAVLLEGAALVALLVNAVAPSGIVVAGGVWALVSLLPATI